MYDGQQTVRDLCPASCQEQDQLKACGGTAEDHTETYKQADAATKAAVAISKKNRRVSNDARRLHEEGKPAEPAENGEAAMAKRIADEATKAKAEADAARKHQEEFKAAEEKRIAAEASERERKIIADYDAAMKKFDDEAAAHAKALKKLADDEAALNGKSCTSNEYSFNELPNAHYCKNDCECNGTRICSK